MKKSIPIPDTPECLASHLGAWAIFPPVLESHLTAFNNGQIPIMSREEMAAADKSTELYNSFIQDNIQVISISGVMQKKLSKLGGTTSTIKLRQSIRAAAADDSIDGVMLHINSPGGTVAGMSELTSDIRKLKAAKPVWTFIDDGAYSAGYWSAVLGDRIYANETAKLGSVGVLAGLIDSSKATEAAGLKVITIKSGALKDFGYPGKEVSAEGLAVEQRANDYYFSMFRDVVMTGRNMSDEQFAKIADASWYVAPDAVSLNMIDAVADWDTAFAEFAEFIAKNKSINPSDKSDISDLSDTNSIKPKQKTLKKGDNLMSAEKMQETAAAFTAAFGAKAGEYMAAGLDFPAAATKHLTAQSKEMENLQSENTQLKTDLASEKAARETAESTLESMKSTAPPTPVASIPLENQESPEAKAARKASEAAAENTFTGKVAAYKTEHKCTDLVAMTAISASHPELYESHLAAQPSAKK